MATIDSLVEATIVGDNDLLLIDQGGEGKKLKKGNFKIDADNVPNANGGSVQDFIDSLANPDNGAAMVGWKRSPLTRAISTVREMLSATLVNIWEYAELVTDRPDADDPSTWDWSPAVQSALDEELRVYIPAGIYRMREINLPAASYILGDSIHTELHGFGGGAGSYMFKASNVAVGANPQAALALKYVTLRGMKIHCQNALDYGVYMGHANFFKLEDLIIYHAKVRNLFIGYCFTFAVDNVETSYCEQAGCSIGENLFGWPAAGAECNAGEIGKLFAYGNGTAVAYDKINFPMDGAGISIGRGNGNVITLCHGEGNVGPGVYVDSPSAVSIHAMYLEANAADGSGDHYQVINKSPTATFQDVNLQYGSTNVFRAEADTTIRNFYGTRITGHGRVSISGYFRDAYIENLQSIDIKLDEVKNYDTYTPTPARIRMNCINMSPVASAKFSYCQVYQVGFFMAFKQATTVPAGCSFFVLDVYGNGLLPVVPIPPGNYVNGDVLYLPMDKDLSGYNSIQYEFYYNSGIVDLHNPDIGLYARLCI